MTPPHQILTVIFSVGLIMCSVFTVLINLNIPGFTVSDRTRAELSIGTILLWFIATLFFLG